MSSKSFKHSDPDRGPPMREGAHHFDKGYVSDDEHFTKGESYPSHVERGNDYSKLQGEISGRDSKKLSREKFSKIA
jgi:hypothetical protein